VVKELLKLIWFSIIKKLLPMSQNTCYLSPQSIHQDHCGVHESIDPWESCKEEVAKDPNGQWYGYDGKGEQDMVDNSSDE